MTMEVALAIVQLSEDGELSAATVADRQVTLAIQLPDASASQHAGIVDRLACLGGDLIFWIRGIHGSPAQARFKFEMEAQRDSFLAVALDIPGVSLAAD